MAQNSNKLHTELPTDKKGVAGVGSKRCTKCKEVKSLDYFNKADKYKSRQYYKSNCLKCAKIYYKKYRDKHKDSIKINHKKFREDNKDSLKETGLKYRIKYNSKILKKENISRKTLDDNYIIKQIRGTSKLKAKDIRKHPELIEAKRLIIKTKRLCKTSQN